MGVEFRETETNDGEIGIGRPEDVHGSGDEEERGSGGENPAVVEAVRDGDVDWQNDVVLKVRVRVCGLGERLVVS